MTCPFPEPGVQSRSISTKTCVSLVVLSITAVLGAMVGGFGSRSQQVTTNLYSRDGCQLASIVMYTVFTQVSRTFLRRLGRFRARNATCQSLGGYRSFLNLSRKPKVDNLFYPFSQSPYPAVRARGDAIQSLSLCPTCATSNRAQAERAKKVKYECPECGWPTHCSKEHWDMDENHKMYCSRLREVNEDEHDLRSGRKMHEFQLPGANCTNGD